MATRSSSSSGDLFRRGHGRGRGTARADTRRGEQRSTARQLRRRCVGGSARITFFKKIGEGEYGPATASTRRRSRYHAADAGQRSAGGTERATSRSTSTRCASRVRASPAGSTRRARAGCCSAAEHRRLRLRQVQRYRDDEVNPFTVRPAFQNALYARPTAVRSTLRQGEVGEPVAGVHGGAGSGIECGKCQTPMRYPQLRLWREGPERPPGRPEDGRRSDLRWRERHAYAIVNRRGQGWTCPNIGPPEANAPAPPWLTAAGRTSG
jgi:hypothetical protein